VACVGVDEDGSDGSEGVPDEEKTQVELVGFGRDGERIAVPVPEGADPTQVEARVREGGGRILSRRITRPERRRPPGISAEDFSRFNEMLASAVRREVPLMDGVRDLARAMGRSTFRASTERAAAALARGEGVETAFAPEASGFPRLYGNLLAAGQAAGNLSEVLLALSRNIRVDAAFRRGVLEACVYPALLFVLCCGFLSGFALQILPRYDAIANELSMTMPWVTRIVTAQTGSGRMILFLILVPIAAAVVIWRGLAGTASGRHVREAMARRVPLFRSLYEAAVWSNAADTLALLLTARVPMPTALRVVGPATGTLWAGGALERLAAEVETGKSLGTAGRQVADIPRPFLHALDTAEVQGDPVAAMEALAERYRDNSERRAELLVRYLPPALAVVFGALVFVVALTVLGPYIKFWGAAW